MKPFSLRTWICILQSSLNSKEENTRSFFVIYPIDFKKEITMQFEKNLNIWKRTFIQKKILSLHFFDLILSLCSIIFYLWFLYLSFCIFFNICLNAFYSLLSCMKIISTCSSVNSNKLGMNEWTAKEDFEYSSPLLAAFWDSTMKKQNILANLRKIYS